MCVLTTLLAIATTILAVAILAVASATFASIFAFALAFVFALVVSLCFATFDVLTATVTIFAFATTFTSFVVTAVLTRLLFGLGLVLCFALWCVVACGLHSILGRLLTTLAFVVFAFLVALGLVETCDAVLTNYINIGGLLLCGFEYRVGGDFLGFLALGIESDNLLHPAYRQRYQTCH